MNSTQSASFCRGATAFTAIAALGLVACGDDSEDYPSDTINYIIPFSPGGASDPLGRGYTEMLGEELDAQFVVENLPGGDTAIGVSSVVNSEPDGYTIGLSTNSGALVNPIANPDLEYGIDDFTVLNRITYQPNGFFTAPDSEYETLDDLLEAARDNPGDISIGTAGALTTTTFAIAALEEQTGIEFNIVVYDGSGESALAAMSGEVDAAVAGAAGQLGLVEAGEIRALAYTGSSDGYGHYLPEAVALEDEGYDIPFPVDHLTIGPAGLPDEVVETLTEATQEILESEEWNDMIESQSLVPAPLFGDDLEEWYKDTYQATEEAVTLLEGRLE